MVATETLSHLGDHGLALSGIDGVQRSLASIWGGGFHMHSLT